MYSTIKRSADLMLLLVLFLYRIILRKKGTGVVATIDPVDLEQQWEDPNVAVLRSRGRWMQPVTTSKSNSCPHNNHLFGYVTRCTLQYGDVSEVKYPLLEGKTRECHEVVTKAYKMTLKYHRDTHKWLSTICTLRLIVRLFEVNTLN